MTNSAAMMCRFLIEGLMRDGRFKGRETQCQMVHLI